ncbi:hypothetical protein AWV80_10945 [Cupriavidus sp. UYMU48A]|nr:hypothetical protein AWV80_10945 [Cupriavidus sp. UYMU48A]RWA56057.1 hypothetical protein AU476_04780 [Cupriavidus sp. UYMSc13B]
MLVPYLTAGDPSPDATVEIALAAIASGADVIELGIPTEEARPSGTEIRDSFARALAQTASETEVWQVCRQLRAEAPETPILVLAFTASIRRRGWESFISEVRRSGVDGLIIADLDEPDWLDRIASYGISPVPLLRRGISPDLAECLQSKAGHIAYRTLVPQTGVQLDIAECVAIARLMRAEATKPYLLGFGLRHTSELRALAPYADGFVIGSELLRRIQQLSTKECLAVAPNWIREWKAALTVTHAIDQ